MAGEDNLGFMTMSYSSIKRAVSCSEDVVFPTVLQHPSHHAGQASLLCDCVSIEMSCQTIYSSNGGVVNWSRGLPGNCQRIGF